MFEPFDVTASVRRRHTHNRYQKISKYQRRTSVSLNFRPKQFCACVSLSSLTYRNGLAKPMLCVARLLSIVVCLSPFVYWCTSISLFSFGQTTQRGSNRWVERPERQPIGHEVHINSIWFLLYVALVTLARLLLSLSLGVTTRQLSPGQWPNQIFERFCLRESSAWAFVWRRFAEMNMRSAILANENVNWMAFRDCYDEEMEMERESEASSQNMNFIFVHTALANSTTQRQPSTFTFFSACLHNAKSFDSIFGIRTLRTDPFHFWTIRIESQNHRSRTK